MSSGDRTDLGEFGAFLVGECTDVLGDREAYLFLDEVEMRHAKWVDDLASNKRTTPYVYSRARMIAAGLNHYRRAVGAGDAEAVEHLRANSREVDQERRNYEPERLETRLFYKHARFEHLSWKLFGERSIAEF